MRNTQFKAKAPKVNREIIFQNQGPEDLTEAIEMFGEKVVFEMFLKEYAVRIQNEARSLLQATLVQNKDESGNITYSTDETRFVSDDEIRAELLNWRPDTTKAKIVYANPMDSFKKLIENETDPDVRRQILEKMKTLVKEMGRLA